MTLSKERLLQYRAILLRDYNRLDRNLLRLDDLPMKTLLRLYVLLCVFKEEDPRRLDYVERKINDLDLKEEQITYLNFLSKLVQLLNSSSLSLYSSSSSGGNNG
jgi:hypothetical protein